MVIESASRVLLKESTSRSANLGKAFESFSSSLPLQIELIKPFQIPSGLLTTNERFNWPALKRKIRTIPNGYIYGLGAGGIFSVCSLFDKDNVPTAMFSVDLLPEAVMVGRIAVDLIKKSLDFDSFIDKFNSRKTFYESAKNVIRKEGSERLQNVLRKIKIRKFYEYLSSLNGENVDMNSLGHKQAFSKENWKILKLLADKDNIGFGLGDFYDQRIIEYVNQQLYFNLGSNVIYTSNIIDCPTENLDESLDSRLALWKFFKEKLRAIDTPNNIFLFSSIEDDLKVNINKRLPNTAPHGFWLY